jgi:CRP-like cAMP-binding protein
MDSPPRNRILSSLPAQDFALVGPQLEALDLPLRHSLEDHATAIPYVHFLERGIASVVINGAGNQSIEVGLIGSEGLTGLPLVMGTDRSPNETYMQVAGAGHRMDADRFRKAMDKCPALRTQCLLFAHVFGIQAANTALANGRAKIEERLARWLLMAQDRAGTDVLPITHELLALMLGVRRAGVTAVLNVLKQQGLISTKRGLVTVLDRKGLLKVTNGFYGRAEKEYRRLFAG